MTLFKICADIPTLMNPEGMLIRMPPTKHPTVILSYFFSDVCLEAKAINSSLTFSINFCFCSKDNFEICCCNSFTSDFKFSLSTFKSFTSLLKLSTLPVKPILSSWAPIRPSFNALLSSLYFSYSCLRNSIRTLFFSSSSLILSFSFVAHNTLASAASNAF